MTSPAPDAFPDKPKTIPGQTVRESLTAAHQWFLALPSERQEAFRQSVQEDNEDQPTTTKDANK